MREALLHIERGSLPIVEAGKPPRRAKVRLWEFATWCDEIGLPCPQMGFCAPYGVAPRSAVEQGHPEGDLHPEPLAIERSAVRAPDVGSHTCGQLGSSSASRFQKQGLCDRDLCLRFGDFGSALVRSLRGNGIPLQRGKRGLERSPENR